MAIEYDTSYRIKTPNPDHCATHKLEHDDPFGDFSKAVERIRKEVPELNQAAHWLACYSTLQSFDAGRHEILREAKRLVAAMDVIRNSLQVVVSCAEAE